MSYVWPSLRLCNNLVILTCALCEHRRETGRRLILLVRAVCTHRGLTRLPYPFPLFASSAKYAAKAFMPPAAWRQSNRSFGAW